MTSHPERIAAAVEAFARGEIVVVVDDDDRENEGDLIVAADRATPEQLALLIRHTSGIICAPLTQEIATRLRLPQMVAQNSDPHATAFTVSVDFKGGGYRSGISAAERRNTVRALADPNSRPDDFMRPGHVFPLVARDGGVLIRSGHTEAAVDLCQLAGLPPVGVIGELMNDDGTVMRGAAVEAFAAAHGLRYVTVADIIAYRQQREKLVTRVAERDIATPYGAARAVTYSTPGDPVEHLAVVFGTIGDGLAMPARIQRECVEDVFGSRSTSLPTALERIGAAGRGVVVYLREAAIGPNQGSAAHPGNGDDQHASAAQRADDWREVGLGAQILRDLGVRSIRVLAGRERRYVGLEGFGVAVEGTETLG